jgi:hypothetical protein
LTPVNVLLFDSMFLLRQMHFFLYIFSFCKGLFRGHLFAAKLRETRTDQDIKKSAQSKRNVKQRKSRQETEKSQFTETSLHFPFDGSAFFLPHSSICCPFAVRSAQLGSAHFGLPFSVSVAQLTAPSATRGGEENKRLTDIKRYA